MVPHTRRSAAESSKMLQRLRSLILVSIFVFACVRYVHLIIMNENSLATVAMLKLSVEAAPSFIFHDAKNNLPQWMTDYFLFHAAQRAQLLLLNGNETNWDVKSFRQEFKFLVMVCRKGESCGGTADRLLPIPSMVRLAAKTKRLLFLYWEQPAALEEFLVPPPAAENNGLPSLDWRLPASLVPLVRSGRAQGSWGGISRAAFGSSTMVNTRYQSYNYGAPMYNEADPNSTTSSNTSSTVTASTRASTDMDDPPFDQVVHDLWHVMFTPSPAVALILREHSTTFHLQPGRYMAVHVRALYDRKERTTKSSRELAENAINCASNSLLEGQDNQTIYFASDSAEVTRLAVLYGAKRNVHVATRSMTGNNSDPVHSNFAPKNATVADIYDTFVDIYLLGMSRCVSRGIKGGYGRMASLISFNPNCSNIHTDKRGSIRKCNWNGNVSSTVDS
jgi:hypothetical protein